MFRKSSRVRPKWYPVTEGESEGTKAKLSGLAPLRCARTLQLANEQASQKKERKKEKHKKEVTDKKKDAQTEPNDL